MSVQNAACDAALARRAQGRANPHPRLILAACILASSLSFIDGSVVNVGLPAIGQSLKGDAEGLQWVINAYLLPLSALLLLGGAAGDRYGKRLMLMIGIALFAAASVACGLAPSLYGLFAARMVQGAGAALLLPSSLAILGAAFEGEARGRAIGVWAAVGAMTGALGPVLGGWLIDTVGWRAIFLLNLPVALGALVLAWRFVPALDEARTPGLDGLGGVLATLGLGVMTYGLTVGSGPGGWTLTAVGAIGVGALLLAAFVLVERRLGDRAMMPLGLFGSRSFIGLSLLTFALYGALGGLLVLVPYVLIVGAHYSATAAGAALLPFPMVMAVASPFAGAVSGRIGSRWLLTGGAALVAVGMVVGAGIGEGGAYWTGVLPCILIIALGMSGAAAPLTTAVLSSVDPAHTASASGFNSAVSRAGGMAATALLGGVLAARGPALAASFRTAALVGAAAALAAAASAFFLLAAKPPSRS